MSHLLLDLRQGARAWLKSPGLAIVAALPLALGIGAVTTIVSVVYGVLWKPFPFQEPERLAVVWERNLDMGFEKMFASPPNYADWRAESESFEALAAFTTRDVTLLRDAPERLRGGFVSRSLFPLLGIEPLEGRFFLEEEDVPGGPPVVVLSHGLWARVFGSRPGVVGEDVVLDGERRTVVGILPPEVDFPPAIALEGELPAAGADLFLPLAIDYASAQRGAHYLTVLGRLAEEATIDAARAELDTVATALERAYPDTNRGWDVSIVPLAEQVTGSTRPALLVLLAAVAFVLLIVCANVANLLLTRAVGRRREIAVRSALGAGRLRLARQLLTESLVLAVAGGLAGILLAHGLVRMLVAFGPASVPRLSSASLDLPVLLAALAASFLAALLFGLAPVLHAMRTGLVEGLRGRDASTSGTGALSVRNALVVAEIALALVLLVAATLLLSSFANVSGIDPGFRSENVVTMTTTLPRASYQEPGARARFLERALSELEAAPEVLGAAAINELPLAHDRQGTSFTVEGEPLPEAGQEPRTAFAVVSPGYFDAMGIPIVRGRGLDDRDREETRPVVVVNETLARLYFPDGDPIGRRLFLGMSTGTAREIVGIVGDVRHQGLGSEAAPNVYAPYLQYPRSYDLTFLLRTASGPEAVTSRGREALASVDETLPLYDVQTLEEVVARSLASRRFSTSLLAAFGAAALALAAIGLFGVMSYTVGQRVPELGLRMALGADGSRLLGLVLGQGARLGAIGIAVGLAGAIGLTRFLSSLLFGVGATEPRVLASVAAALFAVTLLASYLPARRAARVDPLVALRHE